MNIWHKYPRENPFKTIPYEEMKTRYFISFDPALERPPFKLDLDRLHRNFDAYQGRREGSTTLFFYILIGMAQVQPDVYNVFIQDYKFVRAILISLQEICFSENIFCKIESDNIITIDKANFHFHLVNRIAQGRRNCIYESCFIKGIADSMDYLIAARIPHIKHHF